MATKKEVYTVISKALRNNRYRKDKAINKICIRIERKDKHNNFYNRFVNEDIKKKYCTYCKCEHPLPSYVWEENKYWYWQPVPLDGYDYSGCFVCKKRMYDNQWKYKNENSIYISEYMNKYIKNYLHTNLTYFVNHKYYALKRNHNLNFNKKTFVRKLKPELLKCMKRNKLKTWVGKVIMYLKNKNHGYMLNNLTFYSIDEYKKII